MKTKNGKQTGGFTLPELLAYTTAAGLGFISFIHPAAESIRSQAQATRKDAVLIRIQYAKNQFDVESTPSQRVQFNNAANNARYNLLAPLLKEPDPLNLVRGTGITTGLTIGDLGTPPRAD